jgi:hypothetical protein
MGASGGAEAAAGATDESSPSMGHTSTAPRRALRRASALFLASTISVVALAGAAAADQYPPNPGEEFAALCSPEAVVPGSTLTCTVPADVVEVADYGYFLVYSDEGYDGYDIEIDPSDGVAGADGSLVFTVDVPADAPVGAEWEFAISGPDFFDQCYALDPEDFSYLAGPGLLDFADDFDSFFIGDESFSWDEATYACDGDAYAIARGTIVASSASAPDTDTGGTGTGGTGTGGTGTGAVGSTTQAGALPRTGAGAGALALVGLLTAAIGAGTLQAPRLVSKLRRR